MSIQRRLAAAGQARSNGDKAAPAMAGKVPDQGGPATAAMPQTRPPARKLWWWGLLILLGSSVAVGFWRLKSRGG
jgi:hypothetical protein